MEIAGGKVCIIMAFIDAIKKFVIPVMDDENEANEEAEKPQRHVHEEAPQAGIKKAKVVNLSQAGVNKIVVAKLDSSQGAKPIIMHLKERVPVVFSIARLDRNDAARVVDVIYGATVAIEGDMQKVSNDIFLVTPYGVAIAGDVAQEFVNSEGFLDI